MQPMVIDFSKLGYIFKLVNAWTYKKKSKNRNTLQYNLK